MKSTDQQNIITMQNILDAIDQSPNLHREFYKHLAGVVRDDADLRQQLRKEILTEELLLLPTRFTHLEQDVGELKQDMVELKQDMVEVKQDVSRMSGQVGHLLGNDYESRAVEGSRRLVRRHLGMKRATVVHANKQTSAYEFEDRILIPAIDEGRITRRQADQLENADSIIRCEDENGDVVCAVVEISVTVHDDDRTRAVQRAEIFGTATGLRTLPFVVGQQEKEPTPLTPEVPFLAYE